MVLLAILHFNTWALSLAIARLNRQCRLLFLLLYLDGKKKSLVNALHNFCSHNPHFLGILCVASDWFQRTDMSHWYIGESDVITLYCQPGQRLSELFLSFNTNQKPHIKSLKIGNFENKNYKGHSPDRFSSHLNIRKKKLSGYTGLCNCSIRGTLVLQQMITIHTGRVQQCSVRQVVAIDW